jgi:hypothetical protein
MWINKKEVILSENNSDKVRFLGKKIYETIPYITIT